LNIPFLILRIFEAIACLTGFICIRKFKKTYWVYFIFYLLFIVLCENLDAVVVNSGLHGPNLFLFNKILYIYLVIPISFLFFYWLYYKSFRNSKSKWLPITSTVIYLVSWVTDMVYFSRHPSDFSFFSISYSIGNLLLLIHILRFLALLVTSDAILSFKRNTMFWVSLGLLLYYLGCFPFYGIYNVLATEKNKFWFVRYYLLVNFLDCLMYISFSISFIWGEPST